MIKSELLSVKVYPGTTDDLKAKAQQYGVKHAELVRWAISLVITNRITPDNAFGLKTNGGKNGENSH